MQIPSIHPVILIGGVLVALIMNSWSILAVKVSRSGIRVSAKGEKKARRWNLFALILACFFFVTIVLYLFVENVISVIGV